VPPPPDARPRRPAATVAVADTHAGDLLGGYLCGQAAHTLRALRRHREADGPGAEAAEAVRELRRSARRLSAALHTFRGCLDGAWADRTRTELAWLAATLSLEYVYAARQERLSAALQRLTETSAAQRAAGERAVAGRDAGRNALSAGAARAGALLERRLTLARARAHSAALRALGSARFHAVADTVAVLAHEAPLETGAAARPAHRVLYPLAEQARRRLAGAVDALPPPAAVREDAAWHHVRLLLRLHRYAQEVVDRSAGAWAAAATRALDQHRDAAEAAAAAASAAATPRIAPSTAYALGVLHADQRHEAEAARLAFGARWEVP
jgi:CHAD domain-containing protein